MQSTNQLLLTFLLNAVWQIALVALVAAVCARLLRGAPARYRYLLWAAALILSLFLPVLTSSGAFTGNIFARQPSPSTVTEEINLPVAAAPAPLPEAAVGTASPLTIPLSGNLAFGLIAAYAAFAAIGALKLLNAYLRTRAIARSAYRAPLSGNIRAAIEKCRTAIGVENVEVLCSGAVPVPVTIGDRRPLVILPEKFLEEADSNVLVTAIGHEMAHVKRRDYLSNLIFAIFCLPISFHPAGVFLKRRIASARELCCDEMVATRLLTAEIYARSLVTIAGSAAVSSRLIPTTTVGITDAGNLEVRIMSLLKRSEISSYKKSLLVVAAVLLLAIPCVVAAVFVLKIGIASAVAVRQDAEAEPTPPAGDEAKTVEQNAFNERLERLKRSLKEVQDSDLDQKEKEARTEKLKAELKSLQDRVENLGPGEEAEHQRKLEMELKRLQGAEAGAEDRKLQIEKLMRELETLNAAGADSLEKKARLDELTMKLKALQGKPDARDEDLRKRESDIAKKMEIERLAREATVRMDEAMKIAVNQYPGKVVEKGIEIDRYKAGVVYKFLIRGAAGDTTLVIVSGMDGKVIKTEKVQ